MAKDNGYARKDQHPTATWTVSMHLGDASITALADPDTPTQRDLPGESVEDMSFSKWRHPMPTRFDLLIGEAKDGGSVVLQMSYLEAQALHQALGDVLQWDGQ